MKRKKIGLALVIVACLTACKVNRSNDCDYVLKNVPVDTAFYITYDFNGVHETYYQFGHAGHAGLVSAPSIGHDSVRHYFSCRSSYEFDELGMKPGDTARAPKACLMFFDVQSGSGSRPALLPLYQTLQRQNNFTYVDATKKTTLKDTAYMTGVALDIDGLYSTKNVFNFYYYDYNTVYRDVLQPETNYLTVTSVTQFCETGNAYVIEGYFATTLTEYYQMPDPNDKNPPESTVPAVPTYYHITNGKFRLLSN